MIIYYGSIYTYTKKILQKFLDLDSNMVTTKTDSSVPCAIVNTSRKFRHNLPIASRVYTTKDHQKFFMVKVITPSKYMFTCIHKKGFLDDSVDSADK